MAKEKDGLKKRYVCCLGCYDWTSIRRRSTARVRFGGQQSAAVLIYTEYRGIFNGTNTVAKNRLYHPTLAMTSRSDCAES